MEELNVPKGVYTSTLAVNEEYRRTKAVTHDIANELIARGLPLVIVLPGMVYGPGDTSVLCENPIDLLKGDSIQISGTLGACG